MTKAQLAIAVMKMEGRQHQEMQVASKLDKTGTWILPRISGKDGDCSHLETQFGLLTSRTGH